MSVNASRYFILAVLFLAMTALACMLGMRVVAASADVAPASQVASSTCDFTPDAENIVYQTEAVGVTLTLDEAALVHRVLFVEDEPSVAMNAKVGGDVRNVVIVADHGAIVVFDTNTGDQIRSAMPMLDVC